MKHNIFSVIQLDICVDDEPIINKILTERKVRVNTVTLNHDIRGQS